MCVGRHRAHLLEYLAAFLDERTGRGHPDRDIRNGIESRHCCGCCSRNWLASLLPKISHGIRRKAVSGRSTTSAVHTSPKMKWQSRSCQARCAEQISGLTISTARAVPQRTALTAMFQREGGRRTRDVHVETRSPGDAQRALDLDGHRRVGALHVGRGADHRVDVGWATCERPRALQPLQPPPSRPASKAALLGARRKLRAHALRIEDACLVHHVAAALMPEAFSMNSTLDASSGGDFAALQWLVALLR